MSKRISFKAYQTIRRAALKHLYLCLDEDGEFFRDQRHCYPDRIALVPNMIEDLTDDEEAKRDDIIYEWGGVDDWGQRLTNEATDGDHEIIAYTVPVAEVLAPNPLPLIRARIKARKKAKLKQEQQEQEQKRQADLRQLAALQAKYPNAK